MCIITHVMSSNAEKYYESSCHIVTVTDPGQGYQKCKGFWNRSPFLLEIRPNLTINQVRDTKLCSKSCQLK